MSSEGSTPTTAPCGERSAICAVIFPSPQPASRIRSEPLRSSKARTSSAIAFWSDEMCAYPAASHSVIEVSQVYYHHSSTFLKDRAPLLPSYDEARPVQRTSSTESH